MLACHLIVKTNRESGFANRTKFQGKNPISQTFVMYFSIYPPKLELTKLPKYP